MQVSKINKIYCLFILLALCKLAYSQTGWYQINSGTAQDLYDCQFVNNNTGFIAGGTFNSGIILKTTNGGLNWQNVLNINYKLMGIFFIDAQTGYASPSGGPIKKTTNGGSNWFDQSNPLSNSYYLRRVQFVNLNTGWMVGGGIFTPVGTVIYTSNGGSSWITKLAAGENLFYDLHFFNPDTGYVAGIGANTLMKTTNTGTNWSTINNIPNLYGLHFLDQSTGLGCSSYRTVLKSTNGGLNWNIIYTLGSWSNLYSITAIDNINYVSVGDGGVIMRTTNSGLNWLNQISGVNYILNKVLFTDSQSGWITGDTGTILHTTTGGFTYLEPVSNFIPSEFYLEQNYPNPFNPNTKIRFELPAALFTRLIIYDIYGREVSMLVDEELKAGIYSVNFKGENLSSGVYFYKLTAGDFRQTKKMIIIK